ncbi:MAG: sulfatase-like hydrolase/transferase [candidate division KSB1 bacterium]|nr:sulfatase-like hydrolase/transferase [candidate division KSB1 bacterium]MDZ7367395.1 sulfatase-like hydrolase/transferase [candidate division KSB1 bacterium]MDZ7405276.1 sulfatase-like hydrolase/transferase [candidate division KSB1 bacterium]
MKLLTGKNRFFAACFIAILLTGAAELLHAQNPRPNILVIITDDQRFDTVKDSMLRTQTRIFDQGVAFANAYVTTPVCTPSRASIMTGMYASRHGVRNNDSTFKLVSFVTRLREAGYYTGLVGKYLNSEDATPKPGYDYWVGLPSEGFYYNPILNVNGAWKDHQGYLTYWLRDYAIDFLKKAAARNNQPFFLFFNPKTPHSPFEPAPGDTILYRHLSPYRPPNFNEIDVSDKPAWLRSRPYLQKPWQDSVDTIRRRQLQMLWSLDQSLDAILEELKNQGKLDQTAIFYISDNGFFWGEHRLTGKGRIYEPSIRVAFALRYPPLVPAGKIETRLTANIDIAPTIYQLAGLPIPKEVDGRSLLGLFQPQPAWRSELLIEGWPAKQAFSAVHTDRYVYVENENDRAELYDLVKDPYQLQNSADHPANAALVKDLQGRLQKLLTAVEDEKPNDAVPSSFTLLQNHPNPVRSATTIRFVIRRPEHVALQVFDLNGRLVTTLIDWHMNSGEHALKLETSSLPNGVYIYRLQAGASRQQRKLVVLR